MKFFVEENGVKKEIIPLIEAAKLLKIEPSTLRAYIFRKQRPYRMIKVEDKRFLFKDEIK